MSIKLEAASDKDVGQVRAMNEDEVFHQVTDSSETEAIGLFIVADGMGGHAGGEIASNLSVTTIHQALQELFTPADPLQTEKLDTARLEAEMSGQHPATMKLGSTTVSEMIEKAVRQANDVILKVAEQKPLEAGDAGATLTMALVQGTMAYIANVGDSRTYLYRDGTLTSLTEDHSVVARLLAEGHIEPEEIYTHPHRNIIYRSLGQQSGLQVDLFEQALQAGDRLLLCSDGLWEMVRDPEMAKIIAEAPSPTVACQALIDEANANGGKDNIGVVVVWVE